MTTMTTRPQRETLDQFLKRMNDPKNHYKHFMFNGEDTDFMKQYEKDTKHLLREFHPMDYPEIDYKPCIICHEKYDLEGYTGPPRKHMMRVLLPCCEQTESHYQNDQNYTSNDPRAMAVHKHCLLNWWNMMDYRNRDDDRTQIRITPNQYCCPHCDSHHYVKDGVILHSQDDLTDNDFYDPIKGLVKENRYDEMEPIE